MSAAAAVAANFAYNFIDFQCMCSPVHRQNHNVVVNMDDLSSKTQQPQNQSLDESTQLYSPGGNDVDDASPVGANNTIPSVYLVETFYISSKKNTVFQVRLTEKGLSLRKESNGSSKEQTILVQDIIGCRCLRSKRKRNASSSCACSTLPGGGGRNDQQNLRVVEDNSVDLDESDISAYLYIYAYIVKKNRRGGGRRERTTITLRFRSFDKYEDNNKEAQKWRAAIKQLLCDEMRLTESTNTCFGYSFKDTRKVLILLNPKSGSGKARETFQQRVAPIFVEAEIPFDLQVTKHANYAREFVRNKDVFMWRYIVVVGGDGIYYEVVNGLFERPDWDRAIDEIGIGIIPCGSGNGLARTIAHIYK